MALQTVLEKLQIKDEKNILVQGLPSSIEKQFIKLNFAKSVTPLLKSRKIDLALVFAISKSQLNEILRVVFPAMSEEGKLWIAYPKPTSKIASDLCRDCQWKDMSSMGYESGEWVALDSTWCAINFLKCTEEVEAPQPKLRQVSISRTLKDDVEPFNRLQPGKKITPAINMHKHEEQLKGVAAR